MRGVGEAVSGMWVVAVGIMLRLAFEVRREESAREGRGLHADDMEAACDALGSNRQLASTIVLLPLSPCPPPATILHM